MTSIYQKRILNKILQLFVFGILLFAMVSHSVQAQENSTGLSLSVTPTLFQISAVPLQNWESGVKVINNNRHEITIYADVVNFSAQGESGEAKFMPVVQEQEQEKSTLASWISISREPVTIPAEQSHTFPFTVKVPEDATPGGHFAAILIGTQPPKTENTTNVATSQIVTSLFFARVAGDVIEDATIREFRSTQTFVDRPTANFELRFENKGNVHLQPQGEIVISNMWGKERGLIPINQQTHFGNVLPQSIRKFEFSWQGEYSFSDIGRYKAVVSVAYGTDGRKFESSTLYFYVIPMKVGLGVLAFLIVFFLFIRWSIKAYVKRVLILAGVDGVDTYREHRKSFQKEGDVRIVRNTSYRAPVQKGYTDFKNELAGASALTQKIQRILHFVLMYRLFFLSLLVLILGVTITTIFIIDATEDQKDYEIVIGNSDTDIAISSEEILYNKSQVGDTRADNQIGGTQEKIHEFKLTLINSSDTPGAAAYLQKNLESKGYSISSLKSDFEESKSKTVIVYDVALQEQALELSKELNNALLSANPESADGEGEITVYIGNDYTF